MDYEKVLEGIVKIINTTEKSDIGFVNIRDYIDENCPEFKEREDEEIRKAILELVCKSSEILEKKNQEQMIDWLKKQSQQKFEWSEEDEKMFVNIKDSLRNTNKDYSREIDWFNSLRHRKQWKPSEKQINALSDVLSLKDIKYGVLSELLKCLKKLK